MRMVASNLHAVCTVNPNPSNHNRCRGRSESQTAAGYLEGQGDLVSGLIMGIIRVTIWFVGVTTLLTKSP